MVNFTLYVFYHNKKIGEKKPRRKFFGPFGSLLDFEIKPKKEHVVH